MSNRRSSSSTPRPSSSTSSIGTPPVFGRPSPSNSGPTTRRTSSMSNRSLPAATGVWIVNTLFRRTSPHACVEVFAGGHELAGPLGEQKRGVALVEVPDGRLEPERPDRPDPADPEHQLLVEAHLAAADVEDVGDRAVGVVVLGRSVSSSRTGTRPTCAHPHRDREVPARQLDGHVERLADLVLDATAAAGATGRSRGRRAPGGRRRRSSGGSSPCGTAAPPRRAGSPCRRRSSCGRRPGRPGRPSRSPATRRTRTRRRSRRSGPQLPAWRRWNQWSDRSPCSGRTREDVLVLGHERRVVQELAPVAGAAEDRDGVPVARPRRPRSGRTGSSPAGASSTRGCRRGAEPFELRRKPERGTGDRGNANGWLHVGG